MIIFNLSFFWSFWFTILIDRSKVNGQYDWQKSDTFDEIRLKLDSVTSDSCKVLDVNRLFLPHSTVTHVPNLQWLGIDPIFPNRTNLLHVHNLALSRAFFLSFILQKANDNDEPGLMYYYLSTIADVASNRYINASSFYFAPNHAFTPSYRGFFNKTLPLFAPRAFRIDDFNDPIHVQRTSTLNTIYATDLGAIPNNSVSNNYTNEQYRINEWYNLWLPDQTRRHDSKTTYSVQITNDQNSNETFVWHGPPAPSDPPGPVKWFRPYYDCQRSNKWVYGASVPIPDIFPRHTGWRHIEIPMYVATSVIEIDFERIDINQCPIGEGNPLPNYFANTARCQNATTECEPLHGYGFRRGGYQCRCRPGYRLPKSIRTPFKGIQIERSTREEYESSFECSKIGYVAVRTQNVLPIDIIEQRKLINKIETLTGVKTNSTKSARIDPMTLIRFMRSVNPNNCHLLQRNELTLQGDVGYGKEIQFENEARMVLRLAHFFSAFIQTVDPNQTFAEFRVPDRSLNKDQVIGETLATLIGDRRISGVGVVFENEKFSHNISRFAPYAYRLQRNDRKFFVDDLERFDSNSPFHYRRRELYRLLRDRYKSLDENSLEEFTAKIEIRYNSNGHSTIRYDQYPLQYKAATLTHGQWSAPYFDCGGFHNRWMISYGAPFFNKDKVSDRLQLQGFVLVDIPIEDLDINQCGTGDLADNDRYLNSRELSNMMRPRTVSDFIHHQYSRMPNAFRNTHKCDRLSTYCVPILGRRFDSGGYKCQCEQGYEYPFNDKITYFDGQVMEAEYLNMLQNRPSRFDTLACRVASASSIQQNNFVVALVFILIIVFGFWFN
ncbi:hypothetical protein QR98_0018270 [Sarcoptes scabiei]|uniref:GPR158/179 extracellular domain-containing protein n=1 Tax=Sarcoptes scabiei TaxID=52283 RepID=A0A131ZX63_SARSC|nr:hypothetical protein QR98_0018270 [Sarcoptes scabiei]